MDLSTHFSVRPDAVSTLSGLNELEDIYSIGTFAGFRLLIALKTRSRAFALLKSKKSDVLSSMKNSRADGRSR